MLRDTILRASTLASLTFLAACGVRPSDAAPVPSASPSAAPVTPPVDTALVSCRARVDAVRALPALPGAPAFDERRPEFLGRARGEPMVFVREPAPTPGEALSPAQLASRRSFEKGAPGTRVHQLKARHQRDPGTLRALLLREGYAYAPDPHDALAIATDVQLADLFAEQEIWIQRGADTRKLQREERKYETVYRYVDGPLEGRAADLLFGDRVARDAAELAVPLHRDLRALADVEGFDRTRIERRTEEALLVEVRSKESRTKSTHTCGGHGRPCGSKTG